MFGRVQKQPPGQAADSVQPQTIQMVSPQLEHFPSATTTTSEQFWHLIKLGFLQSFA
jgi:hypothetical protein